MFWEHLLMVPSGKERRVSPKGILDVVVKLLHRKIGKKHIHSRS